MPMAEVTSMDELMRHLHDQPPAHYEPFHESPFRLCCPARLIYPMYTRPRMHGKSAAAKRWRG